MTFNTTNGHLRIPKSGIYYMHTTIQFQRNKKLDHNVERLAVDIKIKSFCKSEHSSNKYRNTGFNPKHYVIIPQGEKGGSYSIHTSGIAKLCENDIIYLHIQNMPHSIIIRNGAGALTNFGAFMIAPNCQEEAVSAPVTNATSPTTTSTRTTRATTEPPNNRCSRRDCK